jgi:hypothetical protein
LIFELAAPHQSITLWKGYLLSNSPLRVIDEADEIAARHVGLHDGETGRVFPVDFDRSRDALDLGDVTHANETPVTCSELRICEGIRIVAQ